MTDNKQDIEHKIPKETPSPLPPQPPPLATAAASATLLFSPPALENISINSNVDGTSAGEDLGKGLSFLEAITSEAGKSACVAVSEEEACRRDPKSLVGHYVLFDGETVGYVVSFHKVLNPFYPSTFNAQYLLRR